MSHSDSRKIRAEQCLKSHLERLKGDDCNWVVGLRTTLDLGAGSGLCFPVGLLDRDIQSLLSWYVTSGNIVLHPRTPGMSGYQRRNGPYLQSSKVSSQKLM